MYIENAPTVINSFLQFPNHTNISVFHVLLKFTLYQNILAINTKGYT